MLGVSVRKMWTPHYLPGLVGFQTAAGGISGELHRQCEDPPFPQPLAAQAPKAQPPLGRGAKGPSSAPKVQAERPLVLLHGCVSPWLVLILIATQALSFPER